MIKKVLNNATIMSWASYFVTFGSMLFVFPLLIKVYTPLEQSFWWLLNTIVGFALLADSGFGSVLLRGVAYFKAGANYLPRTKKEFDNIEAVDTQEPNLQKLSDLLTTTNRIYQYLSLLLLVLLLTLGPVIMWNVMKMSGHRQDLWIAYAILIPNCLFQIYAVRWRSFMRGLDFIAKEARINTVMGVGRVVLFVVALSMGLSPLYLVTIMFVETFTKFLYIRNFVLSWFKDHNWKITNRTFFDKSIFKSLWTATWKVGFIQWGNYFVESGNSIIIAQVSNATLMANFLLTTRILNLITNVSRITLYSNIPKIYGFAAKKELRKMKEIASGYMFLGMIIMILAVGVTALFGNSVLGALNKESQLVPMGLFIIMALTQLLDMHSSYHAGIYLSTNHVPFLVPSIVSGIAILGLGFYVMPIYGLAGIILVRFLVQFSFNNWYAPYLSLKLLNWPIMKYIYEFPIYGSTFILGKVKSMVKR